MLGLWNKLHFEEEKNGEYMYAMFKIFSTYICWIIYKKQRLEVRGAVRPLYGSFGVKGLIQYYTYRSMNTIFSTHM
jgi:hypothetical protein